MPRSSYPPGNTQDAFFPRAVAEQMPTIVAGNGVVLTDDGGRDLIDVCSGAFLAALGQGNERVLAAIVEQGRQLTYVYSRMTRSPANARLTGRLTGFLGDGWGRVQLTSGGSEANEMALKMLRIRALARGEPQRTVVVTLMPSYHGASFYTIGCTGDDSFTATWGPMIVEAERIPAPLTYRAPSPEAAARDSLRALGDVIDRIGPERLLAVLVEPIGGQASGVNVPHPSFARGLRHTCDETGAALVFDEIVTAFRTGSALAADHDPSARPDIVTLAKGLGAGYAPLGATVTTEELADEVDDSVGVTVAQSYDASAIACAAGDAVLAEIEDRDLIARAAERGQQLRCGLERLQSRHPLIGDVRGRGLLQAIEIVADPERAAAFPIDVDAAAVIKQIGLDHGLLLYARRQNEGRFGDWLLFAPPLVIAEDETASILERLDRVLTIADPRLRGTLRST